MPGRVSIYKATNIYFIWIPNAQGSLNIKGGLGKFWRGSGELSRLLLKPHFSGRKESRPGKAAHWLHFRTQSKLKSWGWGLLRPVGTTWGGGREGESHPPVLSRLPSCHLRKMLNWQHNDSSESAISCLLCLHWDGDGLWKWRSRGSCPATSLLPSLFMISSIHESSF